MAINIFTVGPGADYETLSGWNLDRAGASSPGDTERAVLTNGVYSVGISGSLVTLAGWTSGVYIEIFGENSHTGDWNVTSQGARVNLSGNFSRGIINSVTNPLYVKDIVFVSIANSSFLQGYIETDATVNVKKTRIFENLMFSGFNNNSAINQSCFTFGSLGTTSTGTYDLDFRNCVFWNCPTKSDGASIYLNSWSSSIALRGYATVRNSTFYNAGIYLSRFWTGYDMTITGIGNIFYRPDTGASITWRHPTGSYSAVSIDQIGSEGDGAHEIAWNTSFDNYLSATSVAGEPSSGQVGFISTGAGNFRLYDSVNNVAINHATSVLGYTGDILGISRSSTYDAGAFELEASTVDVEIEPSSTGIYINVPTPLVGLSPMTAANITSGVAPLGVQFSALTGAGMVLPGTGESHADYSYYWDFGPLVSGAYTHSQRNKRYAANFLAACVFEATGTHTVTCVVTKPDGNKEIYSQNIIVTDPDVVFAGNTYYIDATDGNDSNAGTSEVAAWQTLAKAETELLGENGTYRVLLKRGQTWTESTVTFGNFTGPKYLGAYSTGAKPRLVSTGSTVLEVNGGNVTIVGLDIDGSAISSGSGGQSIRLNNQSIVHQCDVIGGSHSFKTPASAVSNVCISECTSDAVDYGIFVQPGMSRLTLIGNSWDAADTEHHIRSYSSTTLITDCYFDDVGNVTKNAIKMVGDTASIGDNVIAHNIFRTACNWQVSIGPENVSSQQYLDRVLIVANKFRNAVSTCIHVALDNDCWIRNNIFEDGTVTCITIDERYSGIVPNGVQVENNTAHRSSAGNRTLVSVILAEDSPIVRNNILWVENGTATVVSGTATSSNNLTTNPDFVNSASYNYALLETSDAIDAGISNNVREDISLAVREYSDTTDIGAYEFGASILSVDIEPDTSEIQIQQQSQEVIITNSISRSTYKAGIEHVHINLRPQLPDREDAWQAWGEWHLYRDGIYETGIFNVLDFSWPLLPEHDLYYRYAFSDGTTGNWNHIESQATYNWDFEQYVDSTLGNNVNDGLSGEAPVQTIAQAFTNMVPYIASGATVHILLKAGETFAAGTSPVWTGSSQDFRLFFDRYSTGNKPKISCSASSATALFQIGGRSHVVVKDIDFFATNNQSSGGNHILSWDTGRQTDVSIDCGIYNVTCSGLASFLSSASNMTIDDKVNGAADYFFVYNSTNGTPAQAWWQWWGGHNLTNISLVDFTLNYVTGNAIEGCHRVYNWSNLFAHNYRINKQEANPWRIYGGSGEQGFIENMSFSHVTISGSSNIGLLAEVRFQPLGTGTIIRNVRFNGCNFVHDGRSDGGLSFATNEDNATWRFTDIDNISVWNSNFAFPRYTTPSWTGTTATNIEFKNNTTLITSNNSYTNYAIELGDWATRIESGTLNIDSNVFWWLNKNQSRASFMSWSTLTPEAMSGVLGYSDHNVQLYKNTGMSIRWWPDDSNPPPRFDYTYLRSEVCSIFGYDCNSVESSTGYPGDFVNDGSSGLAYFNGRMLVGNGLQTGVGRAVAYSIDADNYLRDSVAPDAGAFEFASVATPERPLEDPMIDVDIEPNPVTYYINTSTGHSISLTSTTQTVLNAYESTYNIGKQHVFFNLRDSIPQEGEMWKGLGEWYVYSPTNTLIKQVNGVLDFSYIGQDGDTVYARYVDSYGYTGQWESYTFDVLPNSSADITYYVASYGSNSNSGTSTEPFQTPQHAISTIRSSLLSGQTAVLYVSGDTTYTFSTAAWAGGSTPRLIRVLKWGNGSNPIFHMTGNSSMFLLGNAESVQVEQINLSGHTGITAGNYGISVSKDYSTQNYPNCSYMMSGAVDRFYIGIGSSDNPSNASRYSGHYDFFGIEDTTFYDNSTYHIYGMRYRRYNHVVNPTFYEPRGDIDVANRLQMWADHYCEGWKCLYTGVTTSIRMQGGDFTVDNGNEYFGPGSWYSGEIVASTNENSVSFQSDAPASGMAIHKDIRYINWKLGNGRFELVGYTTGANCNFDRIDIINCSIHSPNSIIVSHNTGVPYGAVGHLRAINNIGFVSTDTAPRFFTCNAPLSYTNTGTLTFVGNVWSVASGTSGGSKSFYQFANITRDQAADLFTISENNHIGKRDLSAPFMLRASDGDDLIAAWRTRSSFDMDSTINLAYSDPLGIAGYPVQYGYGADGRITSTGSPLYQAGYPQEYILDYDGFVRSSIAPSAGPYEYLATGLPEPPIEDSAIDVEVEPNASTFYISTQNQTSYIYTEDTSDLEIQIDPVDPDTLLGVQPNSDEITVTVSAVDTTEIYADPDPVEFLITTYIQSAAGQVDVDVEPTALELYYNLITPTVLANSNTIYAEPTGETVIYDQPSVGTISSIVYIEEDPSVIGYNISTGVEVLAGTGVITYPGYGSLLVTVVNPIVYTTSLPGGNIPGQPVEPNANSKEYYDYEYVPNQNIDSTNLRVDDNFTTQENIENKDIDIIPILEIATNVQNDVTKLNHNISETFIENTIQQTSRIENRNKVRVVTANYQKFTTSINGIASRFQRRR